MLGEHVHGVGQERRCLYTDISALFVMAKGNERTVSLAANNKLMSWSRITVTSTGGERQSVRSQRRITIVTVRKMLQERALIVRDLLSFLGYLAFVFHGTLDERGDPSLDDIPILLGSVAERFKERPEPTLDAPFQ